ncbi:unnamed protein product [Coregonus sp. 'balchen']|nr:unnamed protein product [Coregonus sp. 'balchen']
MLVIPGPTGAITSFTTRVEREREKREGLLKSEEERKKMEDFNKQWRAQSLLTKQTQQTIKEERERMKEQFMKEQEEK